MPELLNAAKSIANDAACIQKTRMDDHSKQACPLFTGQGREVSQYFLPKTGGGKR